MKVLISVLMIFGLGVLLGDKMASPGVEFVPGPTKTVTVTEPAPPPTEVEVVPESCVDALNVADRFDRATSRLYDLGPAQLKIISQTREAIVMGESLSKSEADQRRLSGHAVASLSNISEMLSEYDHLIKECKAAQ